MHTLVNPNHYSDKRQRARRRGPARAVRACPGRQSMQAGRPCRQAAPGPARRAAALVQH